jgi:hypothetical protein
MSIVHFQPEIWAAQLQESMLKELVFASPQVCNRDYEGQVVFGKSVKITSIGRPTVADYVPNVTVITPETMSDAQRQLDIDQRKFFCFEVDDVDYRQSANGGALMAGYAREGGAGLAEAADTYVQTIMEAQVSAAHKLGAVSVTTSATAVGQLIALKQLLDDDSVPQQNRYCIVPSWFHSLLLTDTRFIEADTSGEGFRNGVVGRALGFTIQLGVYPLSTGDDWYVYAGHPSAVTFAQQIEKVEPFRPQNAFSDALKALEVFGVKVVRPDCIAMVLASVT